MRKLDIVRFPPRGSESFYESVIAKVDSYFKTNRLSPYANNVMWVKAAAMFLLYFVPYTLMVTGVSASSTWLFYGLWFLMSLGMVGIGTSVMHDANHGAFSKHKKVNHLISYMLEVLGGYSVTWRIQHNLLHHTYTNIAGLDEDIHSIKYLRFSPAQPRKWYHRFQYIYVWFFYSIMTLFWMTAKDFLQVIRYKQHDLLIKQKVSLKMALFRITVYKILYYSYIMALMESSAFAVPVSNDGKQQMENSWAIHEVENTTDFAPHNKIVIWFIGGLNYQIEHHLFSGICHVHYPNLAPIVKSVCESYNIAYNVEATFSKAIVGHVKMLKKLGRE